MSIADYFFILRAMIFLLIFILELIFLFISSLYLLPVISQTFFKITKSKTVSVHLLFYLFLPGILIHELSHALCAGLLLVKMGQIKLYPEMTEGGVRFGSLEVVRTDLLRRFLIGIAPPVFGLFLTLAILYSLVVELPFFLKAMPPMILKLFLVYLLFTITNTMFSSKKDLEGAGELIIVVLFILLVLFFAKVKLDFTFVNSLTPFLKTSIFYLAIPLVINAVCFFALKFIGGRGR